MRGRADCMFPCVWRCLPHAPHVIGKFVGADYASNKSACVQADAELERLADGASGRLDDVEHFARHLRRCNDVVGSTLPKPPRYHIAVTRGLDLFDPVASGKSVKTAKDQLQETDRLLG